MNTKLPPLSLIGTWIELSNFDSSEHYHSRESAIKHIESFFDNVESANSYYAQMIEHNKSDN